MLFFLCAMSSGPSTQADSCTFIRKDVELLELERMLCSFGHHEVTWQIPGVPKESPCFLPSIFCYDVFIERQRLCIAAFQFCGEIILLEMRRLLCWEATMGGTGVLGSISIVNIHNEEAPAPLMALRYMTFFPQQICTFDKAATCWIMTQGQAPINSLVYKEKETESAF